MKVVTIGKRLIPVGQVAFVEPFDPASNPEFKPEKDFKARVVLLNRDVVLSEQSCVSCMLCIHGPFHLKTWIPFRKDLCRSISTRSKTSS